jgi:hypothetical protein
MDQNHDTPFALPRWMTVEAVGTLCREAGLAFLDGVAVDWKKLELAAWLGGPYRQATRYGDWTRRSLPPPNFDEHEILRQSQLDDVMRDARWHVLASLEAVSLPSSHRGFVELALSAGHVVPRRDCNGLVAWVPVDIRGMRLRERVESLFAADYLIRPKDYVTELTVCHRCESVLFDIESRRRGDCGMHRPSGISERERRASERPLAKASVRPSAYPADRQMRTTTLAGIGDPSHVSAQASAGLPAIKGTLSGFPGIRRTSQTIAQTGARVPLPPLQSAQTGRRGGQGQR